jgi:hypothetical protein
MGQVRPFGACRKLCHLPRVSLASLPSEWKISPSLPARNMMELTPSGLELTVPAGPGSFFRREPQDHSVKRIGQGNLTCQPG